MRYLLLTLLILSGIACDNGEPIAATSSPLGCWRSDGGELDLKADGSWRQFFDVSPTTDTGTWTYDVGRRELTLIIESASSAPGPAIAMLKIVDLSATEMWTESGATTQWHAVSCPQ